MLKFLKRIFGGSGFSSDFTGEARVYHLLDPCTVHVKKCLFIAARVTTTASDIVLENLEYTGEQEDLPGLTAPIEKGMVLTRYEVKDDEETTHGFKFNNLNCETRDVFPVLSVEFAVETAAEEFALAVSFTLHCQGAPRDSFSPAAVYSLIEVEEASASAPLSQYQLSQLRKTTLDLPFRDVRGEQSTTHSEDDEKALETVICSQRLMEEVVGLYSEEQVLFMSKAQLKEFVTKEERLETVVEDAIVLLVRGPERVYSVDVVEDGELLMRTVITGDFQYKVKERRLSWVHISESAVECWVACTTDSVDNLREMLARVIFEVVNSAEVSKVYEGEDEEWLMGVDSAEVDSPSDAVRALSQKQRVAVEASPVSEFAQRDDLVVVAKQSGLTVLRESQHGFTLALQLTDLHSPDGTALHPESLLSCAESDRVLFLSRDKAAVHTLNIARGAVVQEWRSDFRLERICFQDRDPHSLVIGAGAKSLVAFDPRLPGNRVAAQKSYSSKQNFTAVAGTRAGGLCAATQKGEIKLFTRVGQVAKTSFPGLGSTILSVEVTDDGQWVLGTTKAYLLLLCVGEDDCTGFTTRLGRRKRKPKKLTLLPTDIAKYQIGTLSFTPAKFNRGTSEEFIVTSTGNFLVIWDFAQLKKTVDSANFLTCYEIHPLQDAALQSEFRDGRSSELLLADPQSIHVKVLN